MLRGSKKFGFIVVNDGTFFETAAGRILQIIWRTLQRSRKLNVGAAIIVTGTLVPTPEAKQPFEIQADERRGRGCFRTGLSAAEEASQL